MADTYKALIKLDNDGISNGGTVQEVFFVPDGSESTPWQDWINNSDYSIEDCSSECKPGWIKQDKTGLIIDSNK